MAQFCAFAGCWQRSPCASHSDGQVGLAGETVPSNILVLYDEFPSFLPIILLKCPDAKIMGIFPNSLTSEQRSLVETCCTSWSYLHDYNEEVFQEAHKYLTLCSSTFLTVNKRCDCIIAPRETDLIVAASLREEFKIVGQTMGSATMFRDKLCMKEALFQAGLSVPTFSRMEKEEDLDQFIVNHGLPVVVKPTSASGCRGVHILRNEEDVSNWKAEFYWPDASRYGDMEVESFVEGDLYHIDGILNAGEVQCIWPSRYCTPCASVSFVNTDGSYLLGESNPLRHRLIDFVILCMRCLQQKSGHMLNSAFHAEVFYTASSDCVTFCEVASRVSGCSVDKNWEFAFGINLTTENVCCLLGLPSRLAQPIRPKRLVGSMYVPQPMGMVQNIPEMCPLRGIHEYCCFVKSGTRITSPLDHNGFRKRLVFFFILAATESELLSCFTDFQSWFQQNTSISEIIGRNRTCSGASPSLVSRRLEVVRKLAGESPKVQTVTQE